jgi:hypothetical protein
MIGRMRLDRIRIADFEMRIVGNNSHSATLSPRLAGLLLWFFAGGLAAVVVGWFAAKVHASGYAPLGLTSLAVGAFLGAVLGFAATHLRRNETWFLLLSAILFSSLTIVAEHAWLYLEFRGQWTESREKSPTVAMFRLAEPPAPQVYFARDWNPRLWIADAAIITVATIGVLFAMIRFAENSAPRPPTSDP